MLKPTDIPEWATNTNYVTGPDPGTPTKITPLSGKIEDGGLPEEFPRPQHHNYLFNLNGQWADFVRHRLGRVHEVSTTWYTLESWWLLTQGGTGLATGDYAGGPDGGHGLRLFTTANADFAEGAGPFLFDPPGSDKQIHFLEWEVDSTAIAGTPAVSLYCGFIHDELNITTTSNVLFQKTSGSANWFVRLSDSLAVASETVDTGVVATGVQRFTIAWLGADMTASLSEEIYCYLDGVLVASFDSSNNDTPAQDPMVPRFYMVSTGATDDRLVKVSPVRYTCARYLSA